MHLPGMPSETSVQPLSQPCLPLSDASPQPLGSCCPRRDPKHMGRGEGDSPWGQSP